MGTYILIGTDVSAKAELNLKVKPRCVALSLAMSVLFEAFKRHLFHSTFPSYRQILARPYVVMHNSCT